MGDDAEKNLHDVRASVQRCERLLEELDEIETLPQKFNNRLIEFRGIDEIKIHDYAGQFDKLAPKHLPYPYFEDKIKKLEKVVKAFRPYRDIRDKIPEKGPESVIALHQKLDEYKKLRTAYNAKPDPKVLEKFVAAYNRIVAEYAKYEKKKEKAAAPRKPKAKRKRTPTPVPARAPTPKKQKEKEEEEESDDDSFAETHLSFSDEDPKEVEIYRETVPPMGEVEATLDTPTVAALKAIIDNQRLILKELAKMQGKYRLFVVVAPKKCVRVDRLFDSRDAAREYGESNYAEAIDYEIVKVD